MARIEAVTHVEAPPERVWDVLVDWEAQASWMEDAEWVRVVGERRRGEGTRLRCRTDIAFGLRADDDMTVTAWQPPSVLAVSHEGRLISGVGAFELTATAHGTRFLWWEEISAPLGAVGDAVATALVAPWVRRVFRKSLANIKRVVEATPARG